MQRKESLIEVKVGGLVLLAVTVLVGMVFILGDCNFSKGFTFYVDFTNAAGLKPGAPVRISGIPAGTVRAVEFHGGELDPDVDRRVYVRATVFLEEDMQEAVRQDAQFTITTQSVLGEPYIEISSTNPDVPAVEPGQKFRGTDPPRLDMLMASAYDSLNGLSELVERLNRRGENPIRIDDMINNIADLAGNIDTRVQENADEIDNIFENVDGIIEENREAIPRIVANVEGATEEFETLGASLNRGVGGGRTLRETLENVESITDSIDRDIDPILEDVGITADTAGRILSENEAGISASIENVESLTGNIDEASEDVETIIARIEAGEGSIGMLLRDEEIFEDMREFVRELKRRPWRIIWKE